MNITTDKNIHEIQSRMILIGMLNDNKLIKGISTQMNVLFISKKMDVIKGIVKVIVIYIE